MKIKYDDHGVTATLTLTSWLPWIGQHNRCVDAVLLRTGVRATSAGFIQRKTEISGRTAHVMRAYKVVMGELAR
ncbi:hypothetical protein G3M83_07110 [Rouxiella badensis]|uniref:hypothetical protein n=1 Tax=Rouxiella badensis TaxID=1646377 RepID=UPI0013EF1EA6|nr:hypothetical protein [Rouxiella badensis]QII37482.1 hypothetical protein G3M83_07110 [Rouxiella badensis]